MDGYYSKDDMTANEDDGRNEEDAKSESRTLSEMSETAEDADEEIESKLSDWFKVRNDPETSTREEDSATEPESDNEDTMDDDGHEWIYVGSHTEAESKTAEENVSSIHRMAI
jgi:hypothetical protein